MECAERADAGPGTPSHRQKYHLLPLESHGAQTLAEYKHNHPKRRKFNVPQIGTRYIRKQKLFSRLMTEIRTQMEGK